MPRRIRRRSLTMRPFLLEGLEDRLLLSVAQKGLELPGAADEPKYVANQILIQYNPGVTEDQKDKARGKGRAAHKETIRKADPKDTKSGELELALLEPGQDVPAAIQALKGDATVAFAEPNWILTHQAVLNDTKYTDGTLWGMYGDATSPANKYGSQAGEAWASGVPNATGSSAVYVGIIDEGIDFNHPDLAGNIWTNPFDSPNDSLDNDGNGYINDVHGWDFAGNNNTIYDGNPNDNAIDQHGTHVAGTIGALGGNGIGVAGVNWAVSIISGKFLTPSGGNISNAIKAVDYFTDLKNRHSLNIVATNNSWGGGGYSQAMEEAIVRAAKANILFIAAAGNSGLDNDAGGNFPSNYTSTRTLNNVPGATYDSVVAVAAIDRSGNKASFSNYGATTVDLGAPGVGVWSTTPNGTYSSFSGTSMATPHVTGAAALHAATHPGAKASEIKNAILAAARATQTGSLAGKVLTQGRLHVPAVLNLPSADPDDVGPIVVSSSPTGNYFGSVSSATITFHEDVVAFTIDDVVSFSGPGGDLMGQITGVSGSGTTFTVTFSAQTAFGNYRLVIGPNIQDGTVNWMDQDRDGLQRESVEDQYAVTFSIGETFDSTDPGPIGGRFTVATSELFIGQDLTIADLDVRVNITHPNVGDLQVYLHDPSNLTAGRIILYPSAIQATGSDFGTRDAAGKPLAYTVFDEEAGTDISKGAAPYAGSYKTGELLSKYDGKNARGRWTLNVDNFGSSTGTVNAWSLIIKPKGAAPVAVNDSFSLNEDSTLTVDSPGVLGNDTDVDSATLTAVLVGSPANGTVVLNANGSFTYTPVANFNGSDSFTYQTSDGTVTSNLATVSLTVGAVNDAPVANGDAYGVEQGRQLTVIAPGLLANDTDADGQPLTAQLVSGPTSGTLALNTDGSFSYTPASGFLGTDSFTYKANDGSADSGPATVTIDVTQVNRAPVAYGDSFSTLEDVELTVVPVQGVLVNDTDADGNALTASVETGPAHGTLTLNKDGSFSYAPYKNFYGSDSFTYRAHDGFVGSNVVTVGLTVTPVNDTPGASDDAYTVNQGQVLTASAPGVLANDSDVDSSSLTAVLASGPANGTVTLNPDGSFTYTANTGFSGSDSFTYRANDGSGNSNEAMVRVTVNGASTLSINDVSQAERNKGNSTFTFTITLSAPSSQTVTVRYATANDTATSTSDYTAVLPTLVTFSPGETSKTVSITVKGDRTSEPNETFFVDLSSPTNATILDFQGVGTILNDDGGSGAARLVESGEPSAPLFGGLSAADSPETPSNPPSIAAVDTGATPGGFVSPRLDGQIVDLILPLDETPLSKKKKSSLFLLLS